jgi:hypothetical protein
MANDYSFNINSKGFKTRINRLITKLPDFIKQLMQRIGMRLWYKVRMYTPVDTGLLRRSWTLKKPTYDGKEAKIEIDNLVKYGSPVEYGHNRWAKFYPGRFMLKRAFMDIQNNAPQILEKEIEKFANENLR